LSRIRVHEQRRHAETAQANEAGNRIGCSYERRKLLTAVVWGTQRTAASGSNPFIQRAILFDLKECRSRRSSPRRFSHLVVWEIPAPEIEDVFFNPRSQTPSWLRVHEKCAHRSQNLVSSSPPVPFLFKSIFLPIRFLSGSTARTDKLLESQAHGHYSQLGPPSHVAPRLGRGSRVVTADARDLLQRSQESPRMLRRVLARRAPHPTEKIDIPST